MRLVRLTDCLSVSRLCFGTLTIGPLQANLRLEAGAELLSYAISRGVNFFDTAQLYDTYNYLRLAMERSGNRDIVICTKTYAYTKQSARQAVEEARRKLNRDYIDIFMLHEQESGYTLDGHKQALDYLLECKNAGIIKNAGISTHHIAAVKAAANIGADVIHPIINIDGLGIADGTRDQMLSAIQEAHNKGIGIFAMKILGGGNLIRKSRECFEYALGLDCLDSIAVGMKSMAEVDANIELFETGALSQKNLENLSNVPRRLHIEDWCSRCGKCVSRCGQRAIKLTPRKAEADMTKCVLCGYCGAVCPQWAIKVV
ncbi:MAG: aldo/keto reductase [Oscillospiraceae bacterium]|nr:aldo/keto reductase [Oscillospiraceae bacterium]